MNTKEKTLLKKNLILFLILLGIFVLFPFLGRKVLGNEFKDYLFTLEWQEDYNKLDLDQLRFEFEEDGIVRLGDVTKEDGWIVYRMYPEKAGSTHMTVYHSETGEELMLTRYQVSITGIITEFLTGNFTNYRMYHLNLVLFCVALSVLLWYAFVKAQKVLKYNYQSIFYSGLAIWMTLIAILQIRVWLMEEVMSEVYRIIQAAAGTFMAYTFLPLLAFCIALSVSNISLIRHERFRPQNALGIILSIIIILGAVLYVFMDNLFQSGSEQQLMVHNAVISIYSSIYAFLECFLIGSILCGTLAAKQEPEYDIDYLIILGCMIRPDGTLYPLIRGRVDKAISFYHAQYKTTGKKAVFIPSGGQGSDEIISEAEAMKRYLIEQGIPQDQILLEDQSKNTAQNMAFSKKLIDERNPNAKAAFSTTNYHVFRSGIISRQNNFEPSGMGSPTKWYFWPNAYIREVIGMMSYKWKTMIIILIPIIIFLITVQFIRV